MNLCTQATVQIPSSTGIQEPPANECISDRKLIAAAQAGAANAMNALLLRHQSALYRTARRYGSTPEEVEDLVQDAMLRAFVKIGTFRGDAQFSTWLTAILINSAVSRKRKKSFIQPVDFDDFSERLEYNFVIQDDRRNPERNAIHQELALHLKAALLKLPPKDRAVLMTCVFDSLTVYEAAQMLGASVASVKSRLFRAKRGISESFRRRGLTRRGSNATHHNI